MNIMQIIRTILNKESVQNKDIKYRLKKINIAEPGEEPDYVFVSTYPNGELKQGEEERIIEIKRLKKSQ